MLIKAAIAGLWQKENGGGLGVLFTGMAVLFLTLVVLVNIADYSIFTYKRNAISRAMDYGVTAAVQQIDKSRSIDGISKGFAEETGKKLLDGVEINIDAANSAFLTIFNKNYNTGIGDIDNKLLVCATASQDGRLNYIIRSDPKPVLQAELDEPSMLEDTINQAVTQYWPEADASKVYINGNPKTNMLEDGTYFFALIKDVEITGLYSTRKITLTSFAGARLERIY